MVYQLDKLRLRETFNSAVLAVGMADIESMLSQIRAAALANGPHLLESQLAGMIQGSGHAAPVPVVSRARRSWPPAHPSPEVTPRVSRRIRSPRRDPSAPKLKRIPPLEAGGAGRNPQQRRTPRAAHSPDSVPPPMELQDRTARSVGHSPLSHVARRGRALPPH